MEGQSIVEESTKRRKRRWDQPDESLVSANITLPRFLPMSSTGSLAGNGISVAASGIISANPLTHTMLMPMQAAAVVQKLTQPKIQEELIISREIIINDAESAVRYKLTKRQTQEEIQKCTGAVVITRGKYRPPNAMPDGEKPLYLHISAGAHLTDTAERIMAVDRAAAMVEEMLKPVPKVYSTCVYLGFDADPLLNIPTRIRGPNDQYINHIISATGATISIRGRGSGNTGTNLEEGDQHQPLHLFLSSNNPKALEDARCLAENLLDTISRECGIARALPSKVYTAVPPPQELLVGSLGPGIVPYSSPCSTSLSTLVSPLSANQSTDGSLPSSIGAGTSYSGYSGIYPQATPLQQVALALRQSCGMNCAATASEITNTGSRLISNSVPEKDKIAPQKRKFQELPVPSGGSRFSHQATESVELSRSMTVADKPLRDLSLMPPPKKPAHFSSSIMPPPPPPKKPAHVPSSVMPPPPPAAPTVSRTTSPSVMDKLAVSSPPPSRGMMPPPPAPPKVSTVGAGDEDNSSRLKPETVPDTLVKLLEYGDDDDSDDDEDDPTEGTGRSSLITVNKSLTEKKPFWAL